MSKSTLEKIVGQDGPVLQRLFADNFRRFAGRYLLAFVLMAVVAGATAASAWMMKDLINKVFIDRDPMFMTLICVAVVVIYTAKGLAAYGQEVLLARIGNRIVAEIQERLYSSVLKQDLAFFHAMGSAELITRLTHNARAAATALNLIATSLGRDLLTVLGLVFVMLSQDPLLTAIALIGLPLLFLVVSKMLKKVRKLFTREVDTVSRLVAIMQETVQGIRIVRAFRLEDFLRSSMQTAIADMEDLANKMVRSQAGANPLIDTLGGIAVALVIAYGGWSVIYNGATPGAFFAFITALLMLTDPARRLARLHLSLAGAAVGVRMLYELIDRIPSQQDQPEAAALSVSGGALQLEHVTFGYSDDKPVLQDVSFVAEAGQMTALVGVSGSGKSSILNLLMRFWSPQQGRVLIDGQDLSGVTADSLYDQIALVSQDVFLFDGTIADNIRRGAPHATRAEIEAAARSAHAHDFIMAMEQGYDTPVGEFAGRLSGGQRQRLSIARAFLKNAPILLLDEPTSALDAETDAAIGEALSALSKGRTTVLVAHRFSTILQADRIYVLEAGRIVEQGTHDQLMQNKRVYERLVSLQSI
jgi:subfamily B ATP-binding cassette protein MsbA